ncbi:MAG: iron-sulfur cluster repair di-iron protein, ric [Erysipelothrix sp.]|nr:iron-sulfur cluster repair di-iron protein, ric [Erysipelothrix sp.]
MNQSFLDVFNSRIQRLRQIVSVVDRVHGDHHPEFHDVKALFNQLDHHVIENEGTSLNEVFHALQEVSDHYRVPDDVCETYEAVYVMLKELDQANGTYRE